MDKEEKEKRKEKEKGLALFHPVKITVGETYPFVADSRVTKAKVKKIYMDDSGEKYLVISIKGKGMFSGWKTDSLPIRYFKERILIGGIREIEI